MTEHHHPPLNYEPSLSSTNPSSSTTLPPEVTQCLRNARFLHLATISAFPASPSQPQPHVSLMNYTFLPNYNNTGPVILMTTNNQSLKTQNLRSNPRVSLLVHDWSSHRPPTATNLSGADPGARSSSPPGIGPGRSNLASLLLNLNTSALSSISTTISGEARFLEQGGEEERWCKEAHLANNTFEGQLSTEAGYFGASQEQDKRSGYIEGDDVRVVLVPVRQGRISDFKGGVRDWMVVQDETHIPTHDEERSRGREGLLNGILTN